MHADFRERQCFTAETLRAQRIILTTETQRTRRRISPQRHGDTESMMLLSDREISIRQKPSPFGPGFETYQRAAGVVVLLCRNLPAQQKARHPLCLRASSEAGGKHDFTAEMERTQRMISPQTHADGRRLRTGRHGRFVKVPPAPTDVVGARLRRPSGVGSSLA